MLCWVNSQTESVLCLAPPIRRALMFKQWCQQHNFVWPLLWLFSWQIAMFSSRRIRLCFDPQVGGHCISTASSLLLLESKNCCFLWISASMQILPKLNVSCFPVMFLQVCLTLGMQARPGVLQNSYGYSSVSHVTCQIWHALPRPPNNVTHSLWLSFPSSLLLVYNWSSRGFLCLLYWKLLC